MSLVAAAVCPHPPLIIPEVAAGAAPELDDLRAACDRVIGGLRDAEPDVVVVVGVGDQTGPCDPNSSGSMAGFGIDLNIPLQAGRGGPVGLPLSVTIGAWLLRRRPPGVPIAAATVAADASAGEAAAFGAGLAATSGRVGILAMGDGSACRGVRAPGYDDPRAASYDKVVAQALADADVDALLALDRARSTELRVAGRAPWQALAGAARASGDRWAGELYYEEAPYGVAYFVASWWPS